MWRGPALKGRSPGSSSQVFQQWTEATFSCLGIRLAGAGGGGGGRWQSTASSRKKSILPRDLASSVGICPGDPEAQRPKKRRQDLGGGGWGAEAPALPRPEGPGDHSIRGVPRRRARRPPPPAGPFLPPGTNGKPRSPGLPAPEAPLAPPEATLSWVFGRLGNSSKR